MDIAAHGQIAISRALAEFQAWARLTTDQRRVRALIYVQEGVLDRRQALERYQWCGAFAAWCWMAIRPEIRRRLWPSTYRLGLYGRGSLDANLWPAALAGRYPRPEDRLCHSSRGALPPWTVQPGDVALVGSGPDGGHVVLVESATSNGLVTLSGNGAGMLSSGGRGYGVVRATYPLGQVARIIRPGLADLG